MDIHPVQAPAPPLPTLTREEMAAITASRPAALRQQSLALAALHGNGTDTPVADQNGHVDTYA